MAENNEKKKISPIKVIICLLLAAAVLAAGGIFLPDYVKYNNALDCLSKEQYEEARGIFGSLGDYIDSADRAKYCDYYLAMALFESGEYHSASESFALLGDYKDSADWVIESNYCKAQEFIRNGESDKALEILQDLGSYKDSYVLLMNMLSGDAQEVQLEQMDIATALEYVLPLKEDADAGSYIDIFRNNISENFIAAGFAHTVALRSDGTVLAVGDNSFGQCNTESWTDIVSIAAGGNFTVGLRSDGTIVTAGDNSYGQLNVVSAGKVKAVFAGNSDCAVLLNTGNVLTYGYGEFSETAIWDSVERLSVGAYAVCGVDSEGKVSSTAELKGFDPSNDVYQMYMGVASWLAVNADGTTSASFDGFDLSGVIYGSVGTRYAAALMRDGTVKVHAFREADWSLADFSEWSDFIAVSTRGAHIVAVRSDGTVVALGDNSSGQCNVADWDLF